MDKDHEGGEVFPTMKTILNEKKRKLNYMIHNPNSVEETTKVILDVLVRANADKVERELQKIMHNEENYNDRIKQMESAETICVDHRLR